MKQEITLSNTLPSETLRRCISSTAFRWPRHLVLSAWLEHGPFAFWIVQACRPKVLVELGTHNGFSYFAFCQAIRSLGLPTSAYAVDTWKGDEHAGFYGEQVFDEVRAANAPYAGFSQLIRSTFDEALARFEDGSIDLLHIDGRHRYEDVAHDFQTWRPKLSRRAIVLFHDIEVRERDFGVWKLWEELRSRHPSFEFTHGHGLGVLSIGADIPPGVHALLLSATDPLASEGIRACYSSLGARIQQAFNRGGDRGAAAPADENLLLHYTTVLEQETGRLDRNLAEMDTLRRQVNALREESARLTEQSLALTEEKSRLTGELDRVAATHRALQTSMTWKLAARLQRAIAYGQRARYVSGHAARRLLMLLRLQFGRLLTTLRQDVQYVRQLRAIKRSGLFDAPYYAATSPDSPAYTGGLLRHYLFLGGFEGRRPNPLFDSEWYLNTYADVRQLGMNPLVHYVIAGSAEGRDPNPYFDTDWYAAHNPGLDSGFGAPLRHYLVHGTRAAVDPSPHFAAQWYLEKNPDIARQGVPALEHFLCHGASEGRAPNPRDANALRGRAVTEAVVEFRHAAPLGREIALFVTHSPNGRLKPHVRSYLAALRRHGVSVVLIVAADAPWFEPDPPLHDEVEMLVIRQNEGYDFAAWAHLLHLEPTLLDADILYLLNDSLIGPFNDEDFAALLARVRTDPADLVGLTQSSEHHWHIQSYFLALKHRVLASSAFQLFFNSIVILEDKDAVIQGYEINLAPHLQAAGLSCTTLFASPSTDNATIFAWKELIAQGFPFVKVMTLRDAFPGVDTSDWRTVLAASGFDVAIAEQTLREALSSPRPRRDAARSRVPARSTLRRHLPGQQQPPHVLFMGPWNYSNGLAVASRSYISALRHTTSPINFAPIERPFHIHRRIAPAHAICDFSGPADAAIVHLNPDGWEGLLTQAQREALQQARLCIGLWVWEMDNIPDNWLPTFDDVDAIWAPSRYCRDVFAKHARVPVHVIPHVVTENQDAPAAGDIERTKTELGLGREDKVILYAFDGASYLVRKNPFALVRAFAQSGLASRGWKLVLKTKHLFDSPQQGQALQAQVDDTEGVVLINRALDRESMRNLMAMTDIYASPHCSEGFGLTVAEAMVLGKIVVATDYSGTRDFLDASCGFPVRYTLEKLQDTHGHYTQGNAWAKIDEQHLTQSLVQAAGLVECGDRTLGEAARARILHDLSARNVGAMIQDSLQQLMASTTR